MIKAALKEPLLHFIVPRPGDFRDLLRRQTRRDLRRRVHRRFHRRGRTARQRLRQDWRRPPTQDELRGLIDDYVKDEISYREGVALGLDKNDMVIRRRVRKNSNF